MSRRALIITLAVLLLAGCDRTVDDARGSIRDWCAGNRDYCDMGAVK